MTNGSPNFSGDTPSVSIQHQKRELVMYSVTDEELDTLRALGPTASLTFFGIAVGVGATCWGILGAQKGLSADSHAVFFVGGCAAVLLTLLFAIIAASGYLKLRRLKERIRKEPLHVEVTVEPAGAAGRQWRGETPLV